jgi:hypothetical protein
MPDIHAKLCSPSGAEGWFACAGRAVMEVGHADADTDYSADGTARHSVVASALTSYTLNAVVQSVSDFVGWWVSPDDPDVIRRDKPAGKAVQYRAEWAEEDQDYVDTVRNLAEGGELFVERRVNFEAYTGVKGDSFGTADAIVLRPYKIDAGFVEMDVYELIVVDRKTGYVEVEVEHNKQLMLYALGALAEFGMAYDIARVRLVIHQRKAREWDCSIDELLQFGQQAREKAQLVVDAVAEHGVIPVENWQRIYLNPEPSEDACRYCKAMATCPSMQAKVQAVIGADFDVLKSVGSAGVADNAANREDEYLAAAMSAIGLVEDWCKAIRAETERRLLAGLQVPGFGLELGKQGARKWTDEKAAEEMLRKRFRLPVEKAMDMTVISPTTAEKLVKAGDIGERQWKAAQTLITRADPKPSVKPISVIKNPYVPPNAADDFQPLPETQEAEAGLALC